MKEYKDILVEVTSKCMIGCEFCYHHFGLDGKDLSLEDYMAIISYIKENRISSVSLTGGDVFMNPFLAEIVAITENEGLMVTLLANAKSNQSKIIKWINSGRRINLTFSDFSEESRRFVYKLLSNCESTKKIYFVITYMNQSFEEVHAFINLLNGFNIMPEVNMSFLDESTYMFRENLANVLEKLILLTLQGQIKIISEYVTATIRDYVNEKVMFRCSLNKRLKIDIDGNLFPCPFLYKREHAIRNVINGDNLKNIVTVEHIINKRKKSSCGQCERFDSCLGGCPLGYFYGALFNGQHCFLYNVAVKTIEMLMKE